MKLELNTDPLREWKLHSDWYSPTRLHDSPVKYDFHGDRFIPNRSLMDLDQAYTLLTSRTNYPAKCSFGAEYRRIIDGNLTLDSEGRPFRLLVFRGSPKSSRKSIRYIDELRRNDEEELNSINHPIIERKYSMNLMDWGKKNILAVALGEAVYLWNAENRRIHRLMSSDTMYDLPVSVSWSPNGKTLAVGHLKCSYIQLWDADTCKLTRRLEVDDAMVGVASWNGHILTSGNNKTILNHDVRARNSLVSRVYAHTSRVCGLKWSMSGNLLASGGDDNDVYIWEASRMNSSQFVHRFTHHVSAVKALAWCPYNFDVLASGGGVRDRCIKLWNTQKGTCITSVETGSQICGLEWNKNYKEIASGHGLSPNVDRNDLSLWKTRNRGNLNSTSMQINPSRKTIHRDLPHQNINVDITDDTEIVPIAFGICKGETGPCWTCWMSVLKDCIGDNPNLLFISDRHAVIALAVENEFPLAFHAVCYRHLMINQSLKNNKRKANMTYEITDWAVHKVAKK
nr:cell division cycle 20.5, cofactor of APC complex-like [Tanacetum cinerariifolium]